MVGLSPRAPVAVNGTPLAEDGHGLDHALALGWRLLGSVAAFALQLDFSELGAIDLPPVLHAAADQANLKTIAPLYLASELEAARVLPAVETLAGLFVSGGLQRDVGEASPLLLRFWQSRQQRFAAQERQALFARLFGATAGPSLALENSRNVAFESLLIDLAEALYKLDPVRSLGARIGAETPLRLAATRLAANLIPRSGGLATFAARDLLAAVEAALAILKHNEVQRAVGAHSVWSAVANVARLYLRVEVDVAAHVVRAKTGMALLAWLAEHLPRLEDTTAELVSPDHPVVAAAAEWLHASLALAEQQAKR